MNVKPMIINEIQTNGSVTRQTGPYSAITRSRAA
jgi:hypothetical protein